MPKNARKKGIFRQFLVIWTRDAERTDNFVSVNQGRQKGFTESYYFLMVRDAALRAAFLTPFIAVAQIGRNIK